MRLRVALLDRGADFRDVGLSIDQVMRDAHGVEDRLDDAHAIARRIARSGRGIVPEQPDHHANGLAILDRDATDGVDGVEKARVLDECQGALVAIREAGRDADAFVLLADADELKCRITRNGPQQAAAGYNIGHRKDELDAACFDRGDDGRALELDRVISRRQQIRVHARSPTNADAAKHRRRYLSGNRRAPQRTYLRHVGRACGRVAKPASWIRMNTPWSRLAAALVFAVICGSTDATSPPPSPTPPPPIIPPPTPPPPP